jgi:hypothetical protein
MRTGIRLIASPHPMPGQDGTGHLDRAGDAPTLMLRRNRETVIFNLSAIDLFYSGSRRAADSSGRPAFAMSCAASKRL